MGRPSKNASRMRKLRLVESKDEKQKRLEKNKTRNIHNLINESPQDREKRLSGMKTYKTKILKHESKDNRDRRLNVILKKIANESDEHRVHRFSVIRKRLESETEEEHSHRLGLIRERLSNETEEDRTRRISLIRERLSNETEEDRTRRLSLIRERLSNETEEDRTRRLSLIRERLSNETEEDRTRRLSLIRERLSNETEKDRTRRLSLIRERLSNESEEDRTRRLSLIRERLSIETEENRTHRLGLIHERLSNETEEQRTHRFDLIQKRISHESSEARAYRLNLIYERRATETNNQRSERLFALRNYSSQRILNEVPEKRSRRLLSQRQTAQLSRNISGVDDFQKVINVFADVACAICNKLLYPQQRVNFQTLAYNAILPPELVSANKIISCSRCSNTIKKRKIPPQAYWNKMVVASIPQEIADLTEIEKRFLCRVVPFIKIMKLQNRFSQDWCRGQVVLFAQDVVELAEQLPLRPNQTGLILVVESLENLQRSREFVVDIDKLKIALRWLMSNNRLYRDVRPHFNSEIDMSQIIQVIDDLPNPNINIVTTTRSTVHFKNLNNHISILHGSFHQGDARFSSESRGSQCTGIATVSCVAFSLFDPNFLCKSDIDYMLIIGDKYYSDCIAARPFPINEPNSNYIAANELLPCIVYNRRKVNISGYEQPVYNGHLTNDDSENSFPNLKNALCSFFTEHSYGLLTVNSTTVAVHCRRESESITYFLFDSHARGAKGFKAPLHGAACCMRFNNIDDLHDVLRKNLSVKHSSNVHTLNVYSLTSLILIPEPLVRPEINRLATSILSFTSQHDENINKNVIQRSLEPTKIIETTSMLCSIEEAVPALENILELNKDQTESDLRLAEIKRKVAPPLNIEREHRLEELAWYFLFPDGKNGFKEERDVPITPLDYFQSRIMSSDKRFHRNDYLFYALSVVEYYRAKASVSVSCRLRQARGEQTPQGLVDNIHLTMRNIRGSASYWRKSCSELIAMVRTLGPPTWFVTFSCNDLNWPDMIKALLIADNHDVNEIEQLTFNKKLDLVKKYPVVVARQFSLRVNALMRYIKADQNCLGGPVVDYWYRVEFQNRGSPHLHMLIWCDGIADFSTPEGIAVIDRVISCSLNPESSDLKQLIKAVQIHRHTSTCNKNRENQFCRFGFPRAPSNSTICLGPDEALANNGRFCNLKRMPEESMVNNYNSKLLKLWEGNIDIQPCGNVTAVSYYVAKYASKSEPHDSGDVIRETISRAKRQGGTVWKQLFSVAMAILSKRLVSAPESAYRLCHLPLKMSSRKTIFVNSCKPNERFRLLRIEGNESSIYNNIFDRYAQRPDQLENLSLAEFAVRFETVTNPTWNEEDGDEELRETDKEPARFIRLRDNTRMRIRNKQAVLRTRYYTLNSDREAYYYSLLVCHLPFRDETSILLDGETAEACFLRRQTELKPLQANVNAEQFAHAEQVIQQALAQAAALNAARETINNDNDVVICADEEIVNDNDNFCDDMDDREIMPDHLFLANIRGLNVQQKNLFKKVSQAIEADLNGDKEQLLLFITGGAGSGKSYLLKLLVEHIKRCYAPTIDVLLKPKFVEVASLTGVAARQIFGKTLHSVFSLPIEKGNTMTYKRLTGQKLEQERRKWRHINWLVIDEISMVSYENLRIIHLRLQELKVNDRLFGGVNILLFGDIMQLPPVKGHWCFMQPSWFEAEINLWHQFSFCELTINMRQQNDSEFIDLLNNLRVGELTTNQLELLCERRRIPLIDQFADGVAVRIYPTVKQVDSYNDIMTKENARTHRVYTINAVDESREIATYGKTPPSRVIPKDVNSCGGLLSTLKLAEGSRVMLRRNISVSDGLVNGVMGIVQKLKWPALRRDQIEEGELPESVLIKFDDVTVGNRMKDVNGWVAITPAVATFQATKGYGDVERRMLPLILSWAVTVHKLQGTTLDKAVIDLGKKNFAKGQIYVALSRVKTLEGIALSDLESNKLLSRPHDEKALSEMTRLRSLTSCPN